MQAPMHQSDVVPILTLIALGGLGLLLAIAAFLTRGRAIRLRVPARFESIRWLAALVDELAREAQLGEQAAFQCRLALDEACTNIIEHAYAGNPAGEIEACIRAGRGVCTIRLTDFGEPYDPTDVAPPPRPGHLDDITPGGLGLYLMRAVMDDVRYTPSPRGNRLVMVKHRHRE